MELWTARHGLASIDDAERVAQIRQGSSKAGPDDRHAARRSLFRIATMRGQGRPAIALADSLRRSDDASLLSRPVHAESWEECPRHVFITLGIVGPGYDREARDAARTSEAMADEATDASEAARDVCYSQLWRVSQRDTSTIRRSIRAIRRLAVRIDPAPGWRVTSIDLCAKLLEAALEWQEGQATTTRALESVEALLLEGPQAEVPGNLARLMVARWRELQGRYGDALVLLRGVDPMAWTITAPAVWLAEGRVAALAGDTAGAIHAYSRYLALRDRPDSGAIAAEVDEARTQLAQLTADRRR